MQTQVKYSQRELIDIMPDKNREFIAWLFDELNERGWSQGQLARQAGVSAQAVSYILSDQRNPGLEFCIGVSKAFKYPPEEVLRRARLLPEISTDPERKKRLRRLEEIAGKLSIEELDNAFEYLLWRYRMSKRD